MQRNWIVVASFMDAIGASVARGQLEQEGIECRLRDEHTVGANWLFSNVIGGVKLLVHQADETRALDLLGAESDDVSDAELESEALVAAHVDGVQTPDATPESETDDTTLGAATSVDRQCSHCGSADIFRRSHLTRLVLLPVMVLSPLVGSTALHYLRPWHCRRCGHAWTTWDSE